MDHSNWTPKKDQMNCESIAMFSPTLKTPVRKNDVKIRSFQTSTNSFSVLPRHTTPPSGLTKFIARNPFEADLTNKLHISVISPTVFTKVASPAQKGSPEFAWNIDELALIHPANIDEFPVQQMHCSDPEIEKTAQEAISRFFSENQIIPSPFHIQKNERQKGVFVTTPTRAHEDGNLSQESISSNRETRESWSQTVLTLPPILPANVEEALKPYFNFTQDQDCDNEEANSSNSSNTSLRRKLFSENNDEDNDESNNSILISPVKSKSPFINDMSPPQSGLFFHGTPFEKNSKIDQRRYRTPVAYRRNLSLCNVSPIDDPAFKRTFGTPLACNEISPLCDVSPINNPTLNMSCQSIKSRSKSVAKLDFTKDMSIEISVEGEIRESSEGNNKCKTLFSEEINLSVENQCEGYHTDDETYNDVTHMAVSVENSKKYRYEDKENYRLSYFNTADKSKFLDKYKTNFSESYVMQQSNMLSGNYAQQAAFITSQDTGYQTYNSSHTTSNIDNCSASIKQKLHWDEKITQIDEEVQLVDWSENVRNMISSTPSKYNRCMNDF